MNKATVIDISSGGGSRSRQGHGSQFTNKIEKAVAAVMTHPNLEEAAKAVGISLSTLKRWKATPEFQKVHLTARQEAFSEVQARLLQQSDVYASVLLRAMANPANSPSVRARAAASNFRMAKKGLAVERMERRLAAVEHALKAKDPGQPVPPPAPTAARQSHPGHGSKLPRKLEAAVAAVMSHRNLEEAARAVGVALSTLKRWKKLPEFQEAMRVAGQEVLFQATARLQQHAAAVAVLSQIAVDSKSPAGVQVWAATCLLQLAYEGLYESVLEPRVTAVECAEGPTSPGRWSQAA